METDIVCIQQLSKSYDKKVVIENLDLTLKSGQVYCLLGKNGVGKTTLFSLILDLMPATSGSIKVFNTPNTELNVTQKRNMGVIFEDLALIEELNAEEFLTFAGKVFDLDKATIKKRTQDLFSYFFEDMADLKKSISTYSTGMKKKIAFCAAVMHAPRLLLLDEPFSGLDPMVANQMVQFLNKYKREDRLILISSHDLSYIQKVATHIGVFDNKQLVFNNTIEHFTEGGDKELDTALLSLLKPNDTHLEKIDWL